MKKYSWIFALITALVMIFAGCGNGDSGEKTPGGNNNTPGGDTPGGEEPAPPPAEEFDIKFDLEAFLINRTGTISNFTGTPLLIAGSPAISVITVSGKKALLVAPAASWQGIDLVHNAKPGDQNRTNKFDFKPGDILTLAGVDSYNGGARNMVILNLGDASNNLSGWGPFQNWNSLENVTEFSHDFVLTQEDIDKIIYFGGNAGTDGNPGSQYTGFRIRGNDGVTDAYVLTSIIVKRPKAAE